MDDPHTNNPITIEHDALLVARARENRDAFAALYLRYFDRVHGYCWRRLGNPDDAADATSAIFQRAIESLTTCREESFRSWLFAIAHNVLADFYRSRRVHQFLNDEMLIQDPGALPEEQVMSRPRIWLRDFSPNCRQTNGRCWSCGSPVSQARK